MREFFQWQDFCLMVDTELQAKGCARVANKIALEAYDALQKERDELVDTLHKVIDYGVPGAMLEGSHQFRLMKERDTLKVELEKIAFMHGASAEHLHSIAKSALTTFKDNK